MPAKSKTPAKSVGERLPMLPLKDVVVFPHMVVPLMIGRIASLAAVEESLSSGRPLFLCAQRDADVETPGREDLHDVGVVANILQTLRMPDGTAKIIVEGLGRASLERVFKSEDHEEGLVKPLRGARKKAKADTALMRVAIGQFEEYVRLGQRVAPEIAASLHGVEDAGELGDLVSAHLSLRMDERQSLLEISDPRTRLERIGLLLTRENEMFLLERKVRDRVRDQMERGQREYFLHEQIRALQQELGQREDSVDEFGEIREQIAKSKMPKEAREKAMRELSRYERMPPMSPESSVIRTYLEWLVDMPWSKRTRDSINLKRAEKVLDEDHYGLVKVKERILEFLAVRKLSRTTKGPVLCLVGPPGVGKTSLGKSVARAMGRKFARVSLGGIRDEAEIRGHRRTYIGALPGRILQSMQKCGVKNPLFMLDEIDKMSVDFRGDPSSALLEVLDPEQNMNFSDHYLEVDFDLHEVFFITTANSEYDIPEPLLDRMELVRLSGYTMLEKERIASLFLIPKQLEETGLTEANVKFTKEGLEFVITRYTQEAGVRELERQIANVFRKVARQVVSANGKAKKKRTCVSVTESRAEALLGPPVYTALLADGKPQVGLSIGLAWTVTGGDTLPIETTVMRGKGNLTLTGQLGEVMQESAQAAYTYLRAHAKELKIPSEFWKNTDIHIHVPEGAIPKDGPSAGGAIAVSLLSALRKKAPKANLAMTGEMTLRGRVLGVGGLKEKVIAAHRAGMKTVLVPKENEKDLVEVPKEVQQDIKFIFVDHLDQILRESFPKPQRKRPPKR